MKQKKNIFSPGRQKPAEATEVWKAYERGMEYLTRCGLFSRSDECYRFFNGDQWHGLKTGPEKPPSYNILRPIVEYKLSMVAQNGMSIHYSAMNYGENYEDCTQVCELLNAHAVRTWENLKMDRAVWDLVQDACVLGDSFAYFYEKKGEIAMDFVDTTNILLADEQETDLQAQKYLLIVQRLNVEDVRRAARENGIGEDEISLICADSDTEGQIGDKAKTEVSSVGEGGKCLSILKLYKKDGCVHICRSVRNLVYQPETKITGMTLYPVAQLSWMREKGSSRGLGEVYYRIPNQIEINKGLVRLLSGIKQYAFPHIVYDNGILTRENVNKLSVVGSNIGVSGNRMQKVSDVVQYMQPAQINPMAREIIGQMISQTRELANAGDAVTGQINPEKASGAAIIAVRDAAALPLNGQVAALKQFVEDVARIWYDMWTAYHPNGMDVLVAPEGEAPYLTHISPSELAAVAVQVRVDVSPTNPYSKYATEQSLQNLYAQQAITFEEFVRALDEDSSVPKAKLLDILEARAAAEETGLENFNQK